MSELHPGDADDLPAPRVTRPRRRRSVTESLLSIVLLLEAVLLFFVTLAVFGLKILPPVLAFGGGAAFVVAILVTITLLRWPVGIGIGWIIQLALIAIGLLTPIMYLIGAGFAAFWVWCFVRARQIDVTRRAYLAAHPEAADPTPEGEPT